MSKNQKVEKEFNPGVFMKNFIVTQVLILYFLFMIGDAAIAIGIDDPHRIITRFIPVGIIAFISSFFIIRSSAKKCKKSDEQDMKKKILIAPLIVAVILFAYGLYSVHSNLKEIEDELSIYMTILGEDTVTEEIEKAGNEARVTWAITAVIYLVAAEAGAFLTKNKLNSLMQDEPVVPQINEVASTETQETQQIEPKEEQQEPVNNIKWDL